jgi:ABC-2 type transport system permease protein
VDRRLPQLFADPIGANSTWITSHAIVLAVAWPLLLTAVFFPLSLHRYQRLGR